MREQVGNKIAGNFVEVITMSKELIPQERIENRIYLIREQKVMIDFDIAELYRVPTKVLNQAVRRNIKRFPIDFMFRLSKTETENMRSQFVTSKRGGRRYLPYAFTEQGVAMLSSVLNSERAVQVNIAIIRAFVKLRKILSTHKELANKLNQLEQKAGKHDEEIKIIFDAIKQLMSPPQKKTTKIGFNR